MSIMATVTIYHNISEQPRFEPYKKHDPMRRAYTYITAGYDLATIWRENNVVDGTEMPARHNTRSLSVGDAVMIVTDRAVECHTVEPLGWDEVALYDLHVSEVLGYAAEQARKHHPAGKAVEA